MRLFGNNVGKNRYNALSSKRHYRNDLLIISGINAEPISTSLSQRNNIRNDTRRRFDANNIVMIRQNFKSFKADLATSPARYIIYNQRNANAVSNFQIMFNKPSLRSSIIIWTDN